MSDLLDYKLNANQSINYLLRKLNSILCLNNILCFLFIVPSTYNESYFVLNV